MLAPPSSPTNLIQTRQDYDLQTPEEASARRRLRRRLRALTVLALLTVCGWFAGRPVVHAVRGWQARRAAARAMTAIDQEKWDAARGGIQDANALRSDDTEVARATAVFLTRVGLEREAISHWKGLPATVRLTAGEQRDFATAALVMGDLPLARAHLAQAWPPGRDGEPADWWLGMEMALRLRQNDEALRLGRRLLESPATSTRLRLGAAQLLLALNDLGTSDLARDVLEKTARAGSGVESLDALLLLTRRSITSLTPSTGTGDGATKPMPSDAGMPVAELARLILRHPLAKVSQKLLTYDLRLLDQPGQCEALIGEAVDQFANAAEPENLAALAAWLNGKGEYARIQEILPRSSALRNRALFLQYLDVLGALGQWQEIKELIQGQHVSLEPAYEQMYLARCAEQMDQMEASRIHWSAAIDGAGGNAGKLGTIARYAERNGSLEAAELAYEGAIGSAPQSRPEYDGLLRVYERGGKNRKMLALLQKATLDWPADEALRDDKARLSSLLGGGAP